MNLHVYSAVQLLNTFLQFPSPAPPAQYLCANTHMCMHRIFSTLKLAAQMECTVMLIACLGLTQFGCNIVLDITYDINLSLRVFIIIITNFKLLLNV